MEFVSANPTGPLHVGHGRGAAIGDRSADCWRPPLAGPQGVLYNDAGQQINNLHCQFGAGTGQTDHPDWQKTAIKDRIEDACASRPGDGRSRGRVVTGRAILRISTRSDGSGLSAAGARSGLRAFQVVLMSIS